MTRRPNPVVAVVAVLLAGCSGSPSGPPGRASAVASSASPTATSAARLAEQVYAAASTQTPTPAGPQSVGTPTNEDTPWRIQVVSLRHLTGRYALTLLVTSADGKEHTPRNKNPFDPAGELDSLQRGFGALRLVDPTSKRYSQPDLLQSGTSWHETLGTSIPTQISGRPFSVDLAFAEPSPGTNPDSLTLELGGMPSIAGLRATS